MRRGVNALETSRRSRVCVGGSRNRKTSRLSICSSSSGDRCGARTVLKCVELRWSELISGCLSRALQSASRVSSTKLPSAETCGGASISDCHSGYGSVTSTAPSRSEAVLMPRMVPQRGAASHRRPTSWDATFGSHPSGHRTDRTPPTEEDT